MESLANEYLLNVAPQLAFVSSVLGGFAATFLAQLVTNTEDNRHGEWSTGSAAFSAVFFIVATIASTRIAISAYSSTSVITIESFIFVMSFSLGIFALLIAVGLSGWIRSRKLGIATSLIAFLGALAVLLMFVVALP